MIHQSLRGMLQVSAALTALLVVGACAETGPTSSMDQPALAGAADFLVGDRGNPDVAQFGKIPTVANPEFFEVCKRWEGNPAVAEFEVAADGTTNTVSTASDFYGPFNAGGHDDWMCRDVWLKGSTGSVVTVTETAVVGGSNPYTTAVSFSETGAPGAFVSGLSVTGLVDGATHSGVTAFFTNTEVPPPGGGEGCTPGYWKQPHHFDSWPAAYTPTMLFGDVFEDAFPGMTLVDVLAQGGGGLDALGRHTVAALLNGESGGVSADFSAAEVIAGFNAVYPGTKDDYNSLKNVYAAANEQGCPLN